jgi:lipoprotein-anchoring transpeptidase ErfK/SrfK
VGIVAGAGPGVRLSLVIDDYERHTVTPTTKKILTSVGALLGVLALALGGYLVVTARAAGGGTGQPGAADAVRAHPSAIATTSTQPPIERWLVAKAVRPVTVYKKPSTDAAVKAQLGKYNVNDYPTVFLVHSTRQVEGRTWYDVYVAMRPNGSRGWITEGDVAIYPTTAKIEIDLSERMLTVSRRGQELGRFGVVIGKPPLETPTGFFFINQKLKPSTPNGVFGPLAIGISAFQMKLPASAWAQGGPVAIHGTNQPELIGQAQSHGCVRMRNDAILKVSGWVPTGSPVIIRP